MQQSIVTYGLHSAFVRGLLQGISNNERLTPYDWDSLARTILEPGAYLQLRPWWQDEAVIVAPNSQARQPPNPVSEEQWMGSGTWLGVDKRLQYSDEAILQVRACCLNAWDEATTPGQSEHAFTTITQSSKEPYADFLARLQSAMQGAVTQTDVRDLLLQTVAFENANSECQKALRPLRAQRAPLNEYIKACG